MSEIIDESVIEEFVAESLEHLDAIEPDLLSMEKEGDAVPAETINRVFRAAHNIKGASSFLAFNAITELSHVMENVLDLFRQGKLIPDPDKVDALLAGMDKLRAMIDAPHSCDEVAFDDELGRLKTILEGDSSEPEDVEAAPEPEPEPRSEGSEQVADDTSGMAFTWAKESDEPSEEPKAPGETGAKTKFTVEGTPGLGTASFDIDSERAKSVPKTMQVFAVWVYPGRDLKDKGLTTTEFLEKMARLGQCVASDLDSDPESQGEQSGEKESPCHVLFATIMEGAFLVSHALDIAEDQICPVDRSALEAAWVEEEPPAPAKAAEKPPTKLKSSVKPKAKKPKAPQESPAGPEAAQKVPKDAKAVGHETIRLSVDLVDRLMNLAGELVLGRNQLRQTLEEHAHKNPELAPVMQNVDVVTGEIQEHIMQMRLQPIGNLFNRFPRVVRDLSRQLSKEVELTIEGSEVELDKSIIEALSDPLTHLVRNCVDHAIELPEEREELGKPRGGHVQLNAFHEGGQVIVTVSDDGGGIDTEKVVEKAVASGTVDAEAAQKMGQKERLNLIFLPGLSTAETVTDVSGRGVGMDVVKTNIERLGGHLEIESAPGHGTTLHLRLPLTLAIIPSLIVGAGKLCFAIPQMNVQELVSVSASDISRKIEKVGEADVLRLRGRLLPIVGLADILALDRSFVHPQTGKDMSERRSGFADQRQLQKSCSCKCRKPAEGICERRKSPQSDINVVVLRVGPNSFGLSVEELFDTQEIVVKPLSKHLEDCRCFAGATIMGNGSVAMILDASGISGFARLRFAEIKAEERRRQKKKEQSEKAASGERQSIIIFNNALEEYFALPLASISRLEMTDSNRIQCIGERQFITYRGEGLPLIHLDKLLPVRPYSGNGNELYFIIPKTSRASVGIVASRILDTIETNVSIQKDMAMPPGLLGSAVVEGHLTMFLNVEELLDLYEEQARAT